MVTANLNQKSQVQMCQCVKQKHRNFVMLSVKNLVIKHKHFLAIYEIAYQYNLGHSTNFLLQ